MEIYHNLDELELKDKNILVALGNFDGVHLGHRQLLKELVAAARETGFRAMVFTFNPHPLQVLQPEQSPPLLLTWEEKARQIAELGVDMLVLAPFTKEFSRLTPEDFVRMVLVDKLKVAGIFVGWNYNFGRGGQGDTKTLTQLGHQLGFFVRVVDPVTCQGQAVSSTLIRELLHRGDVDKAATYLGYRPYFRGPVVHGEARGRTIGFPTANVDLPPGLVIPARGVYAVYIILGNRRLKGVANIGVKPTFNLQNRTPNLEVHIFDFQGDIYGEIVFVELVAMIRSEMTFGSVNELVAQVNKDAKHAKSLLANYNAENGGINSKFHKYIRNKG